MNNNLKRKKLLAMATVLSAIMLNGCSQVNQRLENNETDNYFLENIDDKTIMLKSMPSSTHCHYEDITSGKLYADSNDCNHIYTLKTHIK